MRLHRQSWRARIGVAGIALGLSVAGGGVFGWIGAAESVGDTAVASSRAELGARVDEVALTVLHLHPQVRADDDTEADIIEDLDDEIELVESTLGSMRYREEDRLMETLSPLEDVIETLETSAVPWDDARRIGGELFEFGDDLMAQSAGADSDLVEARRVTVSLIFAHTDALTGGPVELDAVRRDRIRLDTLVGSTALSSLEFEGATHLNGSDVDGDLTFDAFDELSEILGGLDAIAISPVDRKPVGPWVTATVGGLLTALAGTLSLSNGLLRSREHTMASAAAAERRAAHDDLTGLLNRSQLSAIARDMEAPSTHGMGLMYIDLDGFKQLNDTLGHHAGDQLLKTVASYLKDVVRECDRVFRIGGDEFIVLLGDIRDGEDLEAAANRVIDAVQQPTIFEGQTIQIGASAGAIFASTFDNLETLIRDADAALYAAKRSEDRRVVTNATGQSECASLSKP